MRKVLISLLLAGAAASPALAAPDGWADRQAAARADRQQAREERQQAREERQQVREDQPAAREARAAALERPQVSPPQRSAPQMLAPRESFDRAPRPQIIDRSQFGDSRQGFDAGRGQRVEQREVRLQDLRDERAQRLEQRDVRLQQRIDARDLRQSSRPLPPVMRTPTPVVSDTPRPGTQPPPRVDERRMPAPQWSTNWRHNDKYDWYNYRRHHHHLFHFGFYYDPFGWNYYPYQIGWRMWPSYYQSNYWLDDPWMYRLPYAPPGMRWVRYWDDAVLVDTWTGEVVDVIHDFFW
jgi:hypothetical protein